jgi:hypothetical protein
MPRKKSTRTKKPRGRKATEKRRVPVERSGTMPDLFDSNKYDAMSEMTESATLQGRDVRNTVSHLQRQEPLDPESAATPTEGKSSMVSPTLDEQAEELRESRKAEKLEEDLRGYRT